METYSPGESLEWSDNQGGVYIPDEFLFVETSSRPLPTQHRVNDVGTWLFDVVGVGLSDWINPARDVPQGDRTVFNSDDWRAFELGEGYRRRYETVYTLLNTSMWERFWGLEPYDRWVNPLAWQNQPMHLGTLPFSKLPPFWLQWSTTVGNVARAGAIYLKEEEEAMGPLPDLYTMASRGARLILPHRHALASGVAGFPGVVRSLYRSSRMGVSGESYAGDILTEETFKVDEPVYQASEELSNGKVQTRSQGRKTKRRRNGTRKHR